MLGIGRTTMYALIKDGVIESISIGRLRRIPADSVDMFVDDRRRVGLSSPDGCGAGR